MKSIRELFPLASEATVAANPQMSAPNGGPCNKKTITGLLKSRPPYSAKMLMNKTEAEFSLMLEAQKRAGEILRYEFEGITLRWADMRYTPDFVVFDDAYKDGAWKIKLIEVKGGHIWDRDIVRFKGARAYWPEFAFEMWQLKKGQGWKRKY